MCVAILFGACGFSVWNMVITSVWKTEGATQLCVISVDVKVKRMSTCVNPKGHTCFVLINYQQQLRFV